MPILAPLSGNASARMLSVAGTAWKVWPATETVGIVVIRVGTIPPTPPALASVYALSKFDQEKLCLMIGRAYNIPTVALRFFNIYGPRQALSNPYTGVLAIFAARLLNGRAPVVFEDGLQRRDPVGQPTAQVHAHRHADPDHRHHQRNARRGNVGDVGQQRGDIFRIHE